MKLTPVVIATGFAILAVSACDRPSTTGPSVTDVTLSIVSGNSQSAPVNTTLTQPVRVRVLNSSGQAVPNFLVDFVVTSGGGSVYGGAELTNSTGYADEVWTLGPRLGSQTLAVRSVNPSTGAPVNYGTFTATATPPANVLVVGTNATGIFMMNANGTGIKQLTSNSADTMPGLSPDHRKIAFVSTLGSGTAVYLMNVNGTNRHLISLNICDVYEPPRFSPDGNLILYVGDVPEATCGEFAEPGLQIVDTLGQVAGGFVQPGTPVSASSWSADGEHFFFSSNEFEDGQNLFKSFPVPPQRDEFLNVGWNTAVELTQAMDVALSAASPDGQHIAFFGAPFPGVLSPGFVYVMDTDGSNVKSITNALGVGSVLSWSPDGNLIAIDHGFMNADGTGYTVVKGCPCQFAWK